MFTSIVSQRTQDGLVSRHGSWTGKVIQDLSRTDDLRGHYWRVSASHRDPQTGAWSMSWQQKDYMGDQRPKGPVYKFTGETWDLKAYPQTVFPWITLVVSLVLAALVSIFTWHVYGDGGGYQPDGSFVYKDTSFAHALPLLWFYIALQWTAARWLYRVEPVRGSKVIYASSAASTASRMYHDQHPGPSYEQMTQQYTLPLPPRLQQPQEPWQQ